MDPELPRAPVKTRRRPLVTILRRKEARGIKIRGLKQFVQEVAQAAGARADQVTVVLSGDEEVRRLNQRFRGKDRPTDVLSFPGGGLPDGRQDQGEMIISVDKARRQAAQRHHSLDTELRYLLIHGFLHLTGMDHEADDGEMEAEEHRLRRRLLPAHKRSG